MTPAIALFTATIRMVLYAGRGNHGGTPGYEPTSFGQWREQPEHRKSPSSIAGAADHPNHREEQDYYSQPGRLFHLMSAALQPVLFDNTARATGDAPAKIKLWHIVDTYGTATVLRLGQPGQ